VSAQIHALGEDEITAAAAEQLERMGPIVVPALAAALAREPTDVRQKVVEVLAQIATPEVLPEFRKSDGRRTAHESPPAPLFRRPIAQRVSVPIPRTTVPILSREGRSCTVQGGCRRLHRW
jgi:hypothetical protein